MLNKINKLAAVTVTGLTLGILSVSGLLAKPAYAHRDCYKQSLGIPGSWTWVCKPHVHTPSSSDNSSCLAVMSYPKKYQWYVKNEKSYPQTFWLSNKKYTINAGRKLFFTSQVGTYATNSCNGTQYKEPTIEFDRYSNDGKYTSKKITIDVTNYRGFYFWKDGNIIKLSRYSNTRR